MKNTEQKSQEMRNLLDREIERVSGGNYSKWYQMGGNWYEVVRNDSGRALGVINHHDQGPPKT